MNVVVLGAAGFIGTNLAMELVKNQNDDIYLVDTDINFFTNKYILEQKNVHLVTMEFNTESDFDSVLKGMDTLYHLVSTVTPTNSNQHISNDLTSNVIFTSLLLEAAVRQKVKKVVFVSSGGTVYGLETNCPLCENTPTNPINSYGIQKVTIEKLLYLYKYMYGLDYRIIRLANPYGPYQRPNGVLGAVTTFTYKALKNETIQVYGDGSVIRDYIYIDDAIRGVMSITNGNSSHRIFNLGCGYGTSINEVLNTVSKVLNKKLDVVYTEARKVDVPVNYLDISRYEAEYGKLGTIDLEEGIYKTACFLKEQYNIFED